MYWLDLVRYADTVGYHGDQDHSISPYRDYVIDAFIDNMPFDQFTREQLGGDLLSEPTIDQRIATGYNRLLQTSHEGGVQAKEYLAIYAADRVRNVSNVWMGATMGCSQCHDHKFDPYKMQDFYSLAAFFADVEGDQTARQREFPAHEASSRNQGSHQTRAATVGSVGNGPCETTGGFAGSATVATADRSTKKQRADNDDHPGVRAADDACSAPRQLAG